MIQSENSKKEILLFMAGLMLALLMASLDNTIVSTAMPQITGSLKGLLYYSLPFTSYLLFSTVVIPIAGKLSDLFSRKIVMLSGLSIFLISSVLCGLSVNYFMFVVCRGFQGIGGGILTSGVFILTAEYFPQRERGKYIGMLASMYGLASLIGPIAGGLITEYLSWRWIFYINMPIGLFSFFLIYKFVPEFRNPSASRRLDVKGVIIFLLAIFPLLLGITETGKLIEWGSPLMFGLFILSAVMFIWFFQIRKGNGVAAVAYWVITQQNIQGIRFLLVFRIYRFIRHHSIRPFSFTNYTKKRGSFHGDGNAANDSFDDSRKYNRRFSCFKISKIPGAWWSCISALFMRNYFNDFRGNAN